MPKANERYCWIKVTDARASPAPAAASRDRADRSTASVRVTGPAPAPGTGTRYGRTPSTDGRPPPNDPLTERVVDGRPPPIAPKDEGRPPPVDSMARVVEGRPPPLAPKLEGRPPPIPPIASRAHDVLAGRPPPTPHFIKKKDELADRWDWDDKTVRHPRQRQPGVEMHVIEGDWEAAKNWIGSKEGARWSKNATALRLMAFKETP